MLLIWYHFHHFSSALWGNYEPLIMLIWHEKHRGMTFEAVRYRSRLKSSHFIFIRCKMRRISAPNSDLISNFSRSYQKWHFLIRSSIANMCIFFLNIKIPCIRYSSRRNGNFLWSILCSSIRFRMMDDLERISLKFWRKNNSTFYAFTTAKAKQRAKNGKEGKKQWFFFSFIK